MGIAERGSDVLGRGCPEWGHWFGIEVVRLKREVTAKHRASLLVSFIRDIPI